MVLHSRDVTCNIIQKANSLGASLAGIVSLEKLLSSPSHKIYSKFESKDKSVLVLALAHREEEPELDWWGGKGGSPGNYKLQIISKNLRQFLNQEFDIEAQLLPYQPGIFLKDAAALAGLGIIGKNNLLITPEFGPRVRLRALILDAKLLSTPKIIEIFSPCDNCDSPCLKACPQKAFASGSYSRNKCEKQMEEDEKNSERVENLERIKYCRACELACPVGKEERQ